MRGKIDMSKVNFEQCYNCDSFVIDDDNCIVYCEKDLEPNTCAAEKTCARYDDWNDSHCISELE